MSIKIPIKDLQFVKTDSAGSAMAPTNQIESTTIWITECTGVLKQRKFERYIDIIGAKLDDLGDDENDVYTAKFSAQVPDVEMNMALAFQEGMWDFIPTNLDFVHTLVNAMKENMRIVVDEERFRCLDYLVPRQNEYVYHLGFRKNATFKITTADGIPIEPYKTLVTAPLHPFIAVCSSLRHAIKGNLREKGDLTLEEQDDLVTAIAALNRAIRTFERMYEQAEKDSAEEHEKKQKADLEQQIEVAEETT
ncbi:hypothetical protein BJ165DRAFT_1480433 [Panaeolus papilionaceus]|nr:hypothetical protein BJ165DRAFT_1480433 [Panaeolus papilionaceus]